MPRRDLIIIVNLVVVMVMFFGNFRLIQSKVCQSIEIRRDPSNLEELRNCTIIVGHLRILLLERVLNESEYDDYTFPNLTEITDYFLMYRLFKLTTLAKMFPNLRVIRGYELYKDFAFIMYRMPDLIEIGLPNLIHIGRGGVMIDHCQFLCYVETVNWTRIGATKLSHFLTNPNCDVCPRNCPDECWNSYTCQKITDDKCHSECTGCSIPNSPKHCDVCKLWKDEDTCVPDCPKHKFKFHVSMQCVREEECWSFWNGTGWTYNGTCINSCPTTTEWDPNVVGNCKFCGDECINHCPGGVVDNQATLESLRTCTHINGSLEIRLPTAWTTKQLEQYFGRITEIGGHLKIGRTGIKSLNFLKRLRVIRGEKDLENKRYALFVYENADLEHLFDFDKNFTLRILNGSISFNGNPQLCVLEIETLVKHTKIQISQSEMDVLKRSNGICPTTDLHVIVTETGPTYSHISWEMSDATNEITPTIIANTIYFIEANKGVNVTTFESKDACDEKGWNSFYVPNNSAKLTNLLPFTRYGFYIKSYTTDQEFQSVVHYFTTTEDDPSEPGDFEVIAINDTTLELSWTTPKFPNGKLAKYNVTIVHEPDYLPMIQQRNYCKYPHQIDEDEVKVIDSPANNTSSNCTCETKTEVRLMRHEAASFCGLDKAACALLRYVVSDSEYNDTGNVIYASDPTLRRALPILRRSVDPTTPANFTIDNGHATSYFIHNLTHFNLYIVFLQACNQENDDGVYHCSPIVMASGRTNYSDSADDIVSVNAENDGNDVLVTWVNPIKPNSVIVSYDIEHKREDVEHSKASSECITRMQYESKYGIYRISSLLPGRYSVRVRATSFAGSGRYSPTVQFEIHSPISKSWIFICLAIIVPTVIIIAVSLWYYYKKKRTFDNIHLITSINPDYAGATYIEDEWEIDRNDIEIIKALGHGSFGMVHRGLIKSRNYPCAIKTVNENATVQDRNEFLNEGSVMKTFNDAHHVIRLLGIVSRGQPPLVVMELMERGDLKSYLRRCREPSQNLTTNEMYRMACEIADGMAYLAAKKFVHRDLAARNCMVAADRTVKIGDFGMARDVYETDYYRKDTVGFLPVRWMAPESLSDGVFTTDSDVWSYGIVLWEMATLAEQPYQGLSNEEVFRFVKCKGKLERPNECSGTLYEVMEACWMWRPIDRPTFRDILDKLVDHVSEGFKLVAFCYSQQGKEHALNAGPRTVNPAAVVTLPEDYTYAGHYDACEEEVELFAGESNRPNTFFPMSSSSSSSSHQRSNKSSPFKFTTGSPPTS